jgi:RNA polymerase sigma-70 factor (sigma-E family)
MDPRVLPGDAADPLSALFASEYSSLCRLAYLLTGDAGRAEEIVMEAFVRSISRWRAVREPRTYVRRSVINLCSNRRRRAWLERHAPTPREAVSSPPEPDDEVWAAVRQLPARQRATVALRYWDDMSEADIADTLGCSTGTVKSQLAKARATLARALGDQEER